MKLITRSSWDFNGMPNSWPMKLTDIIFLKIKFKVGISVLKTTVYFLSDLTDYDGMLTLSSLMFVNFS